MKPSTEELCVECDRPEERVNEHQAPGYPGYHKFVSPSQPPDERKLEKIRALLSDDLLAREGWDESVRTLYEIKEILDA